MADAPWGLFVESLQLPQLDQVYKKPRRSSYPFKSSAEAATAVFVHIAAAVKKLVDADALQIDLDTGDVISLAGRMQDGSAAGNMAGVFDWVHLSNVPDYVRSFVIWTLHIRV